MATGSKQVGAVEGGCAEKNGSSRESGRQYDDVQRVAAISVLMGRGVDERGRDWAFGFDGALEYF
jgi:hypothetical protein